MASSEEDENYALNDVLFDDINENTLMITHYDSEDNLNGLGGKRTFHRVDLEDNNRKRLIFDIEMTCYLKYHVSPYITNIIENTQERVLFWLAIG